MALGSVAQNKQFWFGSNGVYFTQALPMAALTWYTTPEHPSFYLSGGAGLTLSAGAIVGVAGDATLGGPAGFAGIGYQFLDEDWDGALSVELNTTVSRPASGDRTVVDLSVVLNFLMY